MSLKKNTNGTKNVPFDQPIIHHIRKGIAIYYGTWDHEKQEILYKVGKEIN
jgi:hypothetical protein